MDEALGRRLSHDLTWAAEMLAVRRTAPLMLRQVEQLVRCTLGQETAPKPEESSTGSLGLHLRHLTPEPPRCFSC